MAAPVVAGLPAVHQRGEQSGIPRPRPRSAAEPDRKRDPDDRLPGEHAGLVAAGEPAVQASAGGARRDVRLGDLRHADPRRLDSAAAGLCLWWLSICRDLGTCRSWPPGSLAAGVLAATYWQDMVAFQRDEGLSARETEESVQLRPVLARVAWNMFLDRPLLGCGLGQYRDESIYYLHDRATELELENARGYVQHNVFLSLLTETGLVGMGLWVALLGLWGRNAWRLWQASLGVALVPPVGPAVSGAAGLLRLRPACSTTFP